MQRLEVSGVVRLIYKSLGVKGLKKSGFPYCQESNSWPFVVNFILTLSQAPAVQLLGSSSAIAYRNVDCTIWAMSISGIFLHFYIYVFSIVTRLAWRLRVCLFRECHRIFTILYTSVSQLL